MRDHAFGGRRDQFRIGQAEHLVDPEREAVRAAKPDAAVHCAAWTDVDGCERDPRLARLVNADGARHVAEALPRSASLVYISTDFVFGGRKKKPYAEDDKTAPLNVYGKTKRKGEIYVLRHPRAWVVRTSWLYGFYGRHFVRAILAKAERLSFRQR